jgi:hypothetical protein
MQRGGRGGGGSLVISARDLVLGGVGSRKPNTGLEPGETTAVAMSIAPRHFKFS